MKRIIFILALLAIAGCEETEKQRVSREQWRVAETVVPSPKEVVTTAARQSRITVDRIGLVEDDAAYGNRRGIYVIKDRDTGAEYIGVSGIGITEVGSHTAGKATRQDER